TSGPCLRLLAALAACGSALACADMAQTAAVLSNAVLQNEAAKRQQQQTQQVLQGQAAYVQVTASQPQGTANGQSIRLVQVRNGARYDVTGVALRVSYLRGSSVLTQDTSCAGQAYIASGQSQILNCQLYNVQGATGYRVDVTNVQFR